MFTMNDVIQEGHETLKKVAVPVETPIQKDDLDITLKLLQYVISSQNDEYAEKNNLRAAVGIAAPQVNISKRIFAMVCDDGEKNYVLGLVNPKIVSKSSELTYLPMGEGCLSVDDECKGLVNRYKWIIFEAYVLNLEKMKFERKKMRLEGFPAIVFQHEFDHLEGIMFTDKILSEEDIQGEPLDL